MSAQAVRYALRAHRDVVARWATRLVLFVLAAVTAVHAARTPPRAMVPSAVIPASVDPVTSPIRAPNVTAPTSEASPSRWQLANLPNPLVDRWVQLFTTSLKGDVTTALSRGNAYLPMISAKLAAQHMPQELAYLPLIESDFHPNARSRVSAVGLWQFMASTARRFGLTVGSRADDRTNAAKETDAALAYLSQLYDRFGSWYLAAAAYNAGPGTVASAMQRVLGRATGTDADFYTIASHLPAETRNYVPKLIAAARIAKDPDAYGLTS